MPLLLLSCRPVTILLIGLSPSFFWFAKNLSALTRLSHKPNGAACVLNTFASLAFTPSCTTSILLGALRSYWPPQAAHHHLQCFFFLLLPSPCPVDTTIVVEGETVAMWRTYDKVTLPIPSIGAMIRRKKCPNGRRNLWYPLAPACSSSSVLGLFFYLPSIFYTVCPFFLPYRVLPDVAFSIFPTFLTGTLALCIFLTFSRTYCLFHISYIDTCWPQHPTPSDVSFPHFSSYPRNPLFFWLRLELFTILLRNSESLLCARLRALLLAPAGLFFFALAYAMNPPSNIAPAFASSSAFSLPSVANFSNCDISFKSFFVRCALTCSTSTNISFDIYTCNSSQI